MSDCLGGGWAWVRWGKIKRAAIWVGLCEGIAAPFILRRDSQNGFADLAQLFVQGTKVSSLQDANRVMTNVLLLVESQLQIKIISRYIKLSNKFFHCINFLSFLVKELIFCLRYVRHFLNNHIPYDNSQFSCCC